MTYKTYILTTCFVLLILMGVAISATDIFFPNDTKLLSNCKVEESSLYGNWVFPGSDLPVLPALSFNMDNTFRAYDASTNKTSARGHWVYDDQLTAVTLTADIEDNQWSKVLKTDLSIFPDVLSYDYGSKTITLKVTEAGDACNTQNLSINLFNVRLFKQ